MMRINLQLFAYKVDEKRAGGTPSNSSGGLNTSTSIVDYLKSQGDDSSYAARKELAASLGITNYSGTAEQNTAMLNALKNSSGASAPTTSAPKTTSTPANTNVAGSGKSAINGVDQATINKMQSSYQQSDKVTNAQTEADKYLENLKQMSSVTDIVDKSTWDAINTPFQSSTAYQDAMNYTNQLLQQLSSGKTSYTDQIKDLMGQIQNREKFEYDVDSDVLFQQHLASSMASGKIAMQDTIGQASALTGGYGSTYATSAGNQQYNAYIQDAYNNLPEYYQMALEAYQMEGEEMYNQLAMLNNADATEYQRLYDSWNANFSNAQQMYQNEYGAWHDSVNNAFNSASLQLQEHGQLYDQAYNTYNAVQNNANNLYAQEYQKWADEVSNAFNYANLANSDYWDTTNFNESVRQFNENLAQRQSEFAQEMAYKNSALKQDSEQFYASLAQDQSQFEASLLANGGPGGTTMYDNGNLADDYSLTTTEINGVKKAYRDAGGGSKGYDAVDAYLKGIGKYQENEGFQSMIDSYIESADAQAGLPAWYQSWSITNDTVNRNNPFVKGNDDNNDEYTNLNGQTMTYKELKKSLKQSGLSDAEIEAFLSALQAQAKR